MTKNRAGIFKGIIIPTIASLTLLIGYGFFLFMLYGVSLKYNKDTGLMITFLVILISAIPALLGALLYKFFPFSKVSVLSFNDVGDSDKEAPALHFVVIYFSLSLSYGGLAENMAKKYIE